MNKSRMKKERSRDVLLDHRNISLDNIISKDMKRPSKSQSMYTSSSNTTVTPMLRNYYEGEHSKKPEKEASDVESEAQSPSKPAKKSEAK